MMTIEQIKKAIDNKETVYWAVCEGTLSLPIADGVPCYMSYEEEGGWLVTMHGWSPRIGFEKLFPTKEQLMLNTAETAELEAKAKLEMAQALREKISGT